MRSFEWRMCWSLADSTILSFPCGLKGEPCTIHVFGKVWPNAIDWIGAIFDAMHAKKRNRLQQTVKAGSLMRRLEQRTKRGGHISWDSTILPWILRTARRSGRHRMAGLIFHPYME
ncbi:hypothetical protein RvY_03308-1 [Ramazzottius varieornatus]|uniref:Uncharacterized protein n=1 Tax=Ramazzottius varieornatus TaxID=947166 RepID=A0A1D1UTC4_RAMVA|nr:hypothetical protein RvY_03308-1 [Ramazzottius varieornatus]